MKKILLWMGIGVGGFIVLIVIIFVILSFLEPVDENLQAAELPGQNASIPAAVQQVEPSELDSLKSEIKDLKSVLFFANLEKDSLIEQIEFRDGLIEGYKKTIDRLNKDLLGANKRSVSIKELAKTYETMKPGEMRPILEKVDDETVIAIYKNMSSRSRKSIFQALPGERAAIITKRLAGAQTG